MGMSASVRSRLATMPPARFSMVMATGILALGAHLERVPLLPEMLFVLNIGFFLAIGAAALARLALHPMRVGADLADHARAPGFFTLVAAMSVLGAECLIQSHMPRMAMALAAGAAAAWLVLTYVIFALLTVKQHKPALAHGINGGWLLAVVATQSLAVIAALIAPVVEQELRLALNFLALSMWLWGGMLYIWMMSLIFYRYTFFPLSPADLSPPYWINMGAMAISTLAGSLLILNAGHAPLLESMLPFLRGFTVFYWATGTWWIPMLLVLGVWRHLIRRFPLRYDPMYWGAVFPLGMYGVATRRMTQAMELGFLDWVPLVFFGVGFVAWSVLFLGELSALFRARKPEANA